MSCTTQQSEVTALRNRRNEQLELLEILPRNAGYEAASEELARIEADLAVSGYASGRSSPVSAPLNASGSSIGSAAGLVAAAGQPNAAIAAIAPTTTVRFRHVRIAVLSRGPQRCNRRDGRPVGRSSRVPTTRI